MYKTWRVIFAFKILQFSLIISVVTGLFKNLFFSSIYKNWKLCVQQKNSFFIKHVNALSYSLVQLDRPNHARFSWDNSIWHIQIKTAYQISRQNCHTNSMAESCVHFWSHLEDMVCALFCNLQPVYDVPIIYAVHLGVHLNTVDIQCI